MLYNMPTMRQLAVQSLEHLRAGGQERLAVDEEARSILRGWMLQARGLCSAPPAQPATTAPELTVEQKIDLLRRKAAHWKAAQRLGTLREQMVFAVGNPRARLMLVGEAPGYEEERQGEPFVGPAGKLLDKILAAMGLSRQDVYITNVCKFRPSMGDGQGGTDRLPSDEEMSACLPLILAEIRAIQPTCIVCLGGSAARGLLGAGEPESKLRGRWLECQGVPTLVTYHPGYLLRHEALSARRSVWEDMLAVMERLGLPISERQRGYFTNE